MMYSMYLRARRRCQEEQKGINDDGEALKGDERL